MASAYSLVLTKGTHVVDEPARARLLDAIETGARTVEVALDRYQDGCRTTATVVTAHVVALFPLDDEEGTLPANVTPLVRRG